MLRLPGRAGMPHPGRRRRSLCSRTPSGRSRLGSAARSPSLCLPTFGRTEPRLFSHVDATRCSAEQRSAARSRARCEPHARFPSRLFPSGSRPTRSRSGRFAARSPAALSRAQRSLAVTLSSSPLPALRLLSVPAQPRGAAALLPPFPARGSSVPAAPQERRAAGQRGRGYGRHSDGTARGSSRARRPREGWTSDGTPELEGTQTITELQIPAVGRVPPARAARLPSAPRAAPGMGHPQLWAAVPAPHRLWPKDFPASDLTFPSLSLAPWESNVVSALEPGRSLYLFHGLCCRGSFRAPFSFTGGSLIVFITCAPDEPSPGLHARYTAQ